MKKLFFVALLGLTIAACSKKTTDAVTPDNASKVAGAYPLTYYRFDSAAIPIAGPFNFPVIQNGATVLSGTITAVKVTADSIRLDARYVSAGSQDDVFSYGTFFLKSSGAAYTMNFTQAGTNMQIGTIDGKTLNIDFSYPDDYNTKVMDHLVVIGVKQ